MAIIDGGVKRVVLQLVTCCVAIGDVLFCNWWRVVLQLVTCCFTIDDVLFCISDVSFLAQMDWRWLISSRSKCNPSRLGSPSWRVPATTRGLWTLEVINPQSALNRRCDRVEPYHWRKALPNSFLFLVVGPFYQYLWRFRMPGSWPDETKKNLSYSIDVGKGDFLYRDGRGLE